MSDHEIRPDVFTEAQLQRSSALLIAKEVLGAVSPEFTKVWALAEWIVTGEKESR